MARLNKEESIAKKLSTIDEQIEKYERYLAELKEEREELLRKQEEYDLQKIRKILIEKQMTAGQLIQMVQGN